MSNTDLRQRDNSKEAEPKPIGYITIPLLRNKAERHEDKEDVEV